MIDLRSDTVTLPSPAMRDAIARAELGDDVMGEDPTVNRLEERAADRLGKEAALLVSSGTMGNLVALLAHCTRGQEVILGDQCHIFNYEAGGASALGGLAFHTVPTGRFGELAPADLQRAMHPPNIHYAPPGLICLENTHNRCGGTVLTPAYLESVRALADAVGVPIHLDGSRVFNAAVALGCEARDLARTADSVQFCLSKGLAAPIGSLVCGTKDFVRRARQYRKMVGGGMRQAGIIAAAGLVALTEMTDRLAEDHATAHRLAEGLAALPGIVLDLETVQTNLVIFSIEPSAAARPGRPSFVEVAGEAGVLIGDLGDGRFRAVTHYGITDADIDTALHRLRRTWQPAAA